MLRGKSSVVNTTPGAQNNKPNKLPSSQTLSVLSLLAGLVLRVRLLGMPGASTYVNA